jgi:hypothetical protein
MVCIGGARRVWSWKSPALASRALPADAAPGYPWAPSFPFVEASFTELPPAAQSQPTQAPGSTATDAVA